jgi:hypothetical protein
MGITEIKAQAGGEQHRLFMRRILNDLRALEKMLEEGVVQTGVRRIGAEQEMFLVDKAGRPAGASPWTCSRPSTIRTTRPSWGSSTSS